LPALAGRRRAFDEAAASRPVRLCADHERKAYDWPGGKRLAFYLALNVEDFAFGGTMGHTPTALGPPPDPRNYAWREYGLRVGI
jgi:hypothetical protein